MYKSNLLSFKNNQECMKLMISLHEKMEKNLHTERENLLMSMKQDITKYSSSQFLTAMNKDIINVVRDANIFDHAIKSYLDYFVEVMFAAVTNSPIVVGLDRFILPGENAEEGKLFAKESSMDFLKIGKLFDVSFTHCSNVRIGHAFYVTRKNLG